MVFRRDSKVDVFQRQINALRQQLGGEHDPFQFDTFESSLPPRAESDFHSNFGAVEPVASDQFDLDRTAQSTEVSPPPSVPAVPAADSLTSVIAHSTNWSGNVESTGSLHVHGRVEGALVAKQDVFIAEEAEVDASVTAMNVTIAGSVRGTIRCGQRFELLPHGRVAGDVLSPVIVVHEGAAMVGEISMTSGSDNRSAASASIGGRGG